MSIFKSLNDVIRLRVPASETEAEKNYSYLQLVDLHDKLTLVIRKMEEQQNIIRYFEDVRTLLIFTAV
jgi:hypothetical protein